jgi:hypothetical protein
MDFLTRSFAGNGDRGDALRQSFQIEVPVG